MRRRARHRAQAPQGVVHAAALLGERSELLLDAQRLDASADVGAETFGEAEGGGAAAVAQRVLHEQPGEQLMQRVVWRPDGVTASSLSRKEFGNADR